ncbi:hypothetical protein NQ318_018867 [Aromia moschata]|uniref:CHK kinase-like domain-containing protein n=1 Tax=Aromia moschata TaxID=1265417 RepID=A0AAV8ZGE4_9CUCU|nr:hypothetical protein NQ318_018867 [Aromia moschata]
MEVIVLDDLRAQGYQIRDRMQTMNLDHLRLILKEYGKFHAASFALRSQKKEEYKSIIALVHDNTLKYLSDENMVSNFEKGIFEALDIVRDGSDQRLRRKIDLFKRVIEKGCIHLMLDLLNADEPQTVITHGDGWNNNFMFKYKDENQLSPSEIRIIDFQLSALRSPVFDIVHVIYANSSKTELDMFDELLDTYYTAFSNFLREAGCNPDELFPFTDLMKHWEKYSIYGALMIPMILTFGLCDKSDAPDYDDFKEGQEPGSLIQMKIADENQFQERLRAVFEHYLDSCY